VPTLGVLPHLGVVDIDNEDSLALDRADVEVAAEGDVLDVAALRWPRVSNAGDVDPLRLEAGVRVRWVRSVTELGRPDLVVLPGSKDTRGDLAWFRRTGLAGAVERSDASIVAVCAGLQMAGDRIDDPDGVEGTPGTDKGLGWLPVATEFRGDKVLDRPAGMVTSGPGAGEDVVGYRIHHGRVRAEGGPTEWIVGAGGEVLGWHDGGRVVGTTVHGLFERDGFRAEVLRWVARRSGKAWVPTGVDFGAARLARLDRIADAVETHLDLDRVLELIGEGAP
jgi:adenosylcobyric acid synthase